MKTLRNVIIAILIIIVVIVTVLLLTNKKEETVQNETDVKAEPVIAQLKKVQNAMDFFTIEKCVNSYIDYINDGDISSVYYLLDEQYIKDNNITNNNVLQFIHKTEEESEFQAIDMNVIEKENFCTFAVYGIISNYNNLKGETAYIIVKLDLNNRTFSITPLINKSYNKVDDIDIKIDENNIKEKTCNKFDYYMITNEEICRKYIKHYQYNAIYNPERVYEMLNTEYKKQRFKNIQSFKKYVQDNINNIEQIDIEKYLIEQSENGTEYVIIDTNDNYYKFISKNIMGYELILDDYTLKSDKFLNLYSKATEINKAYTNVDIFIKMLNNKDYEQAYNVINQNFRNANFPNQQVFEEYVKQNFYEHNIIINKEVEESSGVYVCTVNLSSGSNLASLKTTKTFIVQLNEGTEFEISFNVI